LAPDRRIEGKIWENEAGASGHTAGPLRSLQAEQSVVPSMERVIPVGALDYKEPADCRKRFPYGYTMAF